MQKKNENDVSLEAVKKERELHFNEQKCSILNKLFNQINNLKIISRNKKKIVIKA